MKNVIYCLWRRNKIVSIQKCTSYWSNLWNIFEITQISHNSGSRCARKSIEGSKDADYSLISKKSLSQKIICWVGAQGQVKLAKNVKTSSDYDVTHTKPKPESKKFFFNLLKDLPNPLKVLTLLLFYRVASYAETVPDDIRSFAVFKGLWHRFRWSVAVCSSALLRTYCRKAYSVHPSSMRLYSRYCNAYSLKRLPESFFKALKCLIDISLRGDHLLQSNWFSVSENKHFCLLKFTATATANKSLIVSNICSKMW